MTSLTKQYVVFHIPTAQYLVCHTSKTSFMVLPKKGEDTSFAARTVTVDVYLLPPGADLSYDTPCVLFRGTNPERMLNKIINEITSTSYHYQDRAIEEFEVQEFYENVIPEHHRWKEFDKDGSFKNEVDIALCS